MVQFSAHPVHCYITWSWLSTFRRAMTTDSYGHNIYSTTDYLNKPQYLQYAPECITQYS